MFGYFQRQTDALEAALRREDGKPKVVESFNPPPLPTMERYRQWQEALRKIVTNGMASKPVELTKWWNEIEAAYERHLDVHISKRADKVVEDLADSGPYLEWDVKKIGRAHV